MSDNKRQKDMILQRLAGIEKNVNRHCNELRALLKDWNFYKGLITEDYDEDYVQFTMKRISNHLYNMKGSVESSVFWIRAFINDSVLCGCLNQPEEGKGSKIPDYGDVMTIDDFQEYCKNGTFMDSDGTGYYANPPTMSVYLARPSAFLHGTISPGFSHVVWFNK